MKGVLITLFVSTITITPALAGTHETDYQARILLHLQVAPKDQMVGLAGWAIVPDATAPGPFRGLLVGGLLIKDGSRWLEVMEGTFIDAEGETDPLLNLRASERTLRSLKFFGEMQYVFDAERLFLSLTATTPLVFRGVNFELGAETDSFYTPTGWKVGIGPRIVFPLPLCKWVCTSASLALAYQYPIYTEGGEGLGIVRSYLVFNF